MILADITLKGFRNYKDAHIKLEEKYTYYWGK